MGVEVQEILLHQSHDVTVSREPGFQVWGGIATGNSHITAGVMLSRGDEAQLVEVHVKIVADTGGVLVMLILALGFDLHVQRSDLTEGSGESIELFHG